MRAGADATAGGEITAPPCPWITQTLVTDLGPILTFDGGAVRGQAGAAAILWGQADPHGARPRTAEATARAESDATALQAEAEGCRLALHLLLGADLSGGRVATLAGDNRLIIRHGRHRERIRGLDDQAGLDASIAAAEAAGWTLRWVLLPRSANGAADRLARLARTGGTPPTHQWHRALPQRSLP